MKVPQTVDINDIKRNIKNGNYFGEIGKFNNTSDRAQCHICGEYYKSVASHARQTHGINAEEYRILFGLKISQGLVSKDVSRRQSELTKSMQNRGILHTFNGSSEKSIVAAKSTKGRKQRLQLIIANKLAHPLHYMDKVCTNCGKTFTVKLGSKQRTCSNRCRKERQRKLAAENEGLKLAVRRYWDETIPSLSEDERKTRLARPMFRVERVEVQCEICRNIFTVMPSYVKPGRQYACSHKCLLLLKSLQHKGKKMELTEEQHQRRSDNAKRRMALNGGTFGNRAEITEKLRRPHPCPICGNIVPTSKPVYCSRWCVLQALKDKGKLRRGISIGHTFSKEDVIKAHKRQSELLSNPEYHKKFAEKISEARGGVSTEVVNCVVCGKPFTKVTWIKKKCCSPECFAKRRQQRMIDNPISKQSDVREKIRASALIRAKTRKREQGRFV